MLGQTYPSIQEIVQALRSSADNLRRQSTSRYLFMGSVVLPNEEESRIVCDKPEGLNKLSLNAKIFPDDIGEIYFIKFLPSVTPDTGRVHSSFAATESCPSLSIIEIDALTTKYVGGVFDVPDCQGQIIISKVGTGRMNVSSVIAWRQGY